MDIDEDHRPRYMVFSKVSLFDSKSTTLKKNPIDSCKKCNGIVSLSVYTAGQLLIYLMQRCGRNKRTAIVQLFINNRAQEQ